MVRPKVVVGFVLFCAFLAAPASAQQASGISGVVKDTSGAALPGVTVEAASPVLIEKSHTAVTDGQGRYSVVDLLPGTYAVTFTLPGFATFKRDGVVLTSGFIATVNADMQIGSLEETITVTGEAPLVDTRTARRQEIVSDDVLEALPTSTKSVNAVVTLTPGLSAGDGRSIDPTGQYSTQVGGTYHGKGGTKTQFDGMGVQNLSGTGNTGYMINAALVEEMVLSTSGITAESNADGVLINMVPKSGGNMFSGSASGVYSNDKLESNNINAKIRDLGLTDVGKTLKIYDATLTLGGPIRKDRLWFFAVGREWGNGNENPGVWWNKTQGTPFYTPDYSRPATRFQWFESKALRVTWAASQKNKFNFLADVQDVCVCRSGSGVGSPPESALAYHFRPGGLYQASWTAPITSRLLLEAAASDTVNHWPQFRSPGVEPQHISIRDLGTGLTYNARVTYDDPNVQERYGQRFSASYVTGTHSFKAGMQMEEAKLDAYRVANGGDVSYTFRNTVPVQLTQYATPYQISERVKADLGIFAQDQWTLKRLTMNLGVRFDYFNSYVPAQHAPAGRFTPERTFEPVYNVPNWKDINPRVGAAYDLFGNGRTALKASLGRFVEKTGVNIADANNPLVTAVNTTTRSWNDSNGNYVPDCDLTSALANGECGPWADANFGGRRIGTVWGEDVLHGWGVRSYNWDLSTELQHQLGPTVSLRVGYFRNWYGNFRVTDNVLVGPQDYDAYKIVAPRDSRLPNGGGYEITGLYDLNPSKFGQVSNRVVQASRFGSQRRVSDFVNFSMDTRFRSSATLGAGIDGGRTVDDSCFVVDSPQQLLNCRVVTPFAGTTEFKMHGSYPLPADFVVSGVLQNMPGVSYVADYAAGLAEITPSLGRPLSGRATNAVVPLLVPQTTREDRISRLDVRVGRRVRIARATAQVNFDIYNVFNAVGIFQTTNAFGARWRLPTFVMGGRILQFGAQVNF